MSKRKIKLQKKLLNALDLPEDSGGLVVKLTVMGNENMLIENHNGLFEYALECVRVKTSAGLLVVGGADLNIIEVSGERLYISGKFASIQYEQKINSER